MVVMYDRTAIWTAECTCFFPSWRCSGGNCDRQLLQNSSECLLPQRIRGVGEGFEQRACFTRSSTWCRISLHYWASWLQASVSREMESMDGSQQILYEIKGKRNWKEKLVQKNCKFHLDFTPCTYAYEPSDSVHFNLIVACNRANNSLC